MKKFLSLVLALALVLGMATVAFAADYALSADKTKFIVDLAELATVEKVTVAANGEKATGITFVQETDRVTFDAQAAGTLVVIDYTNTKGELKTVTFSVPAAPAPEVQPSDYIKAQLKAAYDANATVAYFDLTKMEGEVLTAADVAYINNTWKDGWYADYSDELGYKYLALDLYFYNGKDGTTYYISAADYDYTWTTGIDFTMTNGVVGYDQDQATIANAIRKMTGDVKQPYLFGFAQPTKAGYSTTVPTMTISKVIPQQWMNVYGHKNLSLSVYTHAEGKCPECSAATGEHIHALTADIVVDAATQTQRIEFVTNTMYKTLVLAKNAVAAPEATDKTDDANPNTGVNDMVNVAIVFAVVSLIAAGSFVFSKASR